MLHFRGVLRMDWSKLWTAVGGRKFVGFCAACAFLATGHISEQIWAIAFAVYVGSNVAQKALLKG